MTREREGDLHAVEMMRSIRDDLSRKFKGMTHEEQHQFIKEQLAKPGAEKNEETSQALNAVESHRRRQSSGAAPGLGTP